MRSGKSIFPILAILLLPGTSMAANSAYTWDAPSAIDSETVLFGELPDPEKSAPDRPKPGDKSYPWYYIQKGNKHFLAGELEKAETSYREAYSVPGSTRVLSGFKLIEILQKIGRTDDALEVLDGLQKKYLVSAREFGAARSIRSALLDEKLKKSVKKAPLAYTGREWVLELSARRVRFVLDGMDILRAHGVPLKESYQGYVFLLDEHYLTHPEDDASDPAKVLAALVYERDTSARIPIDRWRQASSELPSGFLQTPTAKLQTNFTGAEWITMTHQNKLKYVAEAMATLENQRVPMNKSLYGYVEALDGLFTETPELPAADSATALASFLYESEPKARQVLEALRLE